MAAHWEGVELFKQGTFTNDANMTPDQVARKRALIAAMLPKFGSARYVGEGIGQLATGVMAGRQNRKLDEIEGKGTASANALFERLMGTANSATSPDMAPLSVLGMKPTEPAPPITPVDPTNPEGIASDAMAAIGKGATPEGIRAGLIARGLPEHVADGFLMNFQDESGLNPGINEISPLVPGSRGGFGLAQWTGPRRKALEAFAAEKGMPVSDPNIQMDFLMTELQGPESRAWSAISGTDNAGDAGAAIVNSFLRPAESHRASREAEYLSGGGMPSDRPYAPGTASADPGIPINELYMALQNPWLAPEQKALITSMIARQEGAADPLRQLELQKAEIELAQLQNPQDATPDELIERRALAEAGGLQPGTPEYQAFILTGEMQQPADPGYRTMTAEEVKQLGLPPGSYQVGPKGEIKPIGGGGTNMTVNNVLGTPPADDALRKKLMEAEGVTWGEYIKSGSTASGMAQDMELLSQVIEMAPQGPIAGRLAEAFPGVSDAAGVFQSVVKRVAPSLRVEGSGAQSDIEYNGFLQSLPALSNRPEANRAIATFLNAKAAINMERGKVIQGYQSGQYDATEARRRIAELDARSIMTPELSGLLGAMDGGTEGDLSTDDAEYLRSLGLEP